MQMMTTSETLRVLRLIRAYADEVASEKDNPRRQQSLRRRIDLNGILHEEEESMREDPVIHSPKPRG